MRTLKLMILLLALGLCASAQQNKQKPTRTISLYGHVYDSFTHASLKAKVTLMSEDSTIVDTVTSNKWGDGGYRFNVSARNKNYIVRAVVNGYDTCYVNYNVRHIVRNNYFDMPWHYMKRRKNTSLSGEHDLDEVVVTGTKIRMVQRGDTIVYDASAFNLPEGSMLDALVRQLPGAELRSNGDIYVNGRKIDYLTLNGDDFFKGKNKVMLDNLPYYTVKDIKVYNKSTERSRFFGRDVEKKDFVMDVNLKKEYSHGLMGNIEGGAGTDDRYLARLFSLMTTDKNRLGIYGNMNNVNEDRSPGNNGDWEPSRMTQGLKTTKEAGFNFSHKDAEKLDENLIGNVIWTDEDSETKSHEERFASSSDITNDSHSNSRNKDFKFNLKNKFVYKELVHKPYSFSMDTEIKYDNAKEYSSQNDSTLQGMMLVNWAGNGTYGHKRDFSFSHTFDFQKKLPWGDELELAADVKYNNVKPSDNNTWQRVEYLNIDSVGYRNYNTDTRKKSYNYDIEGIYTMNFRNNWGLIGRFTYQQIWTNGRNESLVSHDDKADGFAFDPANSYRHNNLERNCRYFIRFGYSKGQNGNYEIFSLDLTGKTIRERMRYHNAGLDTLARRTIFTLTPHAQYYLNNNRWIIIADYRIDTRVPEFTSLMPFTDMRNALSHTVNNTS